MRKHKRLWLAWPYISYLHFGLLFRIDLIEIIYVVDYVGQAIQENKVVFLLQGYGYYFGMLCSQPRAFFELLYTM